MTLSDLTRDETAALDCIDRDSLVQTLLDLVAIPSVTGSEAESQAQHWYAGRLAGAGMDTDLWSIDLPEITGADDFPGMEVDRTEGWGLVGYWGDDGPTVVLNGHIDVVPPGDRRQWPADPFDLTLRGGVAFGRGACDMKGGLACNLQAVEALREAGVRPRVRVAVQSVVGEEDGGLGTYATLRRGHSGDAAIITEPTCGTVVPANGGALTFRLLVHGKASHASMRRTGVSTIEKFCQLYDVLGELETRRNQDVPPLMAHLDLPYPISVGTVRAGDWASSVPDLLVAEGRLGVQLDERPAAARAEFEGAVAAMCAADPWLAEHPVTVEWYGGQFASGGLDIAHPWVAQVAEAHRVAVGAPAQVRGASYGSDLRLMTGAGIPTLQYGPGDVAHAHSPDEHVTVDDLVRVTAVLILSILRFPTLDR